MKRPGGGGGERRGGAAVLVVVVVVVVVAGSRRYDQHPLNTSRTLFHGREVTGSLVVLLPSLHLSRLPQERWPGGRREEGREIEERGGCQRIPEDTIGCQLARITPASLWP
ncbi:hypothetical protein E2C01_078839 [Portunus trituberculatus]|uniref:Uncharacterized protein n=1 Tax=Portunus trituberculatus TaxID=210409 RepID=A0A5B7IJX2_PORTR|nr:hypothetical protein [Portunus trituberculatus]